MFENCLTSLLLLPKRYFYLYLFSIVLKSIKFDRYCTHTKLYKRENIDINKKDVLHLQLSAMQRGLGDAMMVESIERDCINNRLLFSVGGAELGSSGNYS